MRRIGHVVCLGVGEMVRNMYVIFVRKSTWKERQLEKSGHRWENKI
jgi:hypothetical protein